MRFFFSLGYVLFTFISVGLAATVQNGQVVFVLFLDKEGGLAGGNTAERSLGWPPPGFAGLVVGRFLVGAWIDLVGSCVAAEVCKVGSPPPL
ncbi:hypothetical protein NL676_035246 [Syzygium grande]|nr:hypothetical protein NL676_035246 [Syzygium grande]